MDETQRVWHGFTDFQQPDQTERASHPGKRGSSYLVRNVAVWLMYAEYIHSCTITLHSVARVLLCRRYSCGPTVYDHAHLGHAWYWYNHFYFMYKSQRVKRVGVKWLYVCLVTALMSGLISCRGFCPGCSESLSSMQWSSLTLMTKSSEEVGR